MKTTKIGQYDLYVRSADIEATGHNYITPNYAAFSTITFSDGEVLSKVAVESSLDHFASIGADGRFVFIKAGRKWFLIAMEFEGKFRVATATGYIAAAPLWTALTVGAFLLALPGLAMIAGAYLFPGMLLAPLPLGVALWASGRASELKRVKKAADFLRKRKSVDAQYSTVAMAA